MSHQSFSNWSKARDLWVACRLAVAAMALWVWSFFHLHFLCIIWGSELDRQHVCPTTAVYLPTTWCFGLTGIKMPEPQFQRHGIAEIGELTTPTWQCASNVFPPFWAASEHKRHWITINGVACEYVSCTLHEPNEHCCHQPFPGLPARYLACRKSRQKFVTLLIVFLFWVRICPNTVAFAALLEDNSEPLLKQTLNCSATSGKCSCSKLWDFVRLLPGDWLLLLGNFVWGWQVFRDFMASYRLCHNFMRKLHFSLVMLRKRCVCMLEGVFRWKKPPRGCWCSVSWVFRGSYLFSFM